MGKDVKGSDRGKIYVNFHSQGRESEEFTGEMVSGEIINTELATLFTVLITTNNLLLPKLSLCKSSTP
jgi:hypothetical protein